jgi:hypothetical protein
MFFFYTFFYLILVFLRLFLFTFSYIYYLSSPPSYSPTSSLSSLQCPYFLSSTTVHNFPTYNLSFSCSFSMFSLFCPTCSYIAYIPFCVSFSVYCVPSIACSFLFFVSLFPCSTCSAFLDGNRTCSSWNT